MKVYSYTSTHPLGHTEPITGKLLLYPTQNFFQPALAIHPAHTQSTSILKTAGKTIPVQVWTGPEGSRWFRLPYFKTVGT